MKHKALWLLAGILTLTVGLETQTVLATDIDAGNFAEHGQISSFDRGLKKLVIRDKTYSVSDYSTNVYSDSGKLLTLDALQSGRVIRFNVESDRKSAIKDILLLPAH